MALHVLEHSQGNIDMSLLKLFLCEGRRRQVHSSVVILPPSSHLLGKVPGKVACACAGPQATTQHFLQEETAFTDEKAV